MPLPDPLADLAREIRTGPPPRGLRVLALLAAAAAHLAGLALLFAGLTGAFA